MNPNNIELLAPAGSYEGFEAALGAGADAVYVGGAMFGARAYAQNFNEEELLRAIDVAHIHGKKLYLTVNTLLKNRELKEELVSYLEPYYNAGLDAVIVQDMGVFSLLKKEFPKLHLHARGFCPWSTLLQLFRTMSDEQSFGRQKRKQRSLCPALPSAIPGEEFQGKRVWKRRILPVKPERYLYH